MTLHTSHLQNLTIGEDADWRTRVTEPDGSTRTLILNGRASWKKVSAVCHARCFALRNPMCKVHVEIFGYIDDEG